MKHQPILPAQAGHSDAPTGCFGPPVILCLLACAMAWGAFLGWLL